MLKEIATHVSIHKTRTVIHLPTLSHSDSDQETDVDEPETVSAPSETES